jgi:hypothetical protein
MDETCVDWVVFATKPCGCRQRFATVGGNVKLKVTWDIMPMKFDTLLVVDGETTKVKGMKDGWCGPPVALER